MVVSELLPGSDIARNWPVITAAYSGLEQTIKFLIAEEKGCTIRELVDQSNAGRKHSRSPHKEVHPFRTHNIAWLFSKLEKATQSVAHDFYRRFQSLHLYVPIPQVDRFLELVSAKRGTGYER